MKTKELQNYERIEDSSMPVTKGKKLAWKRYVLYDSSYRTF